jgi:catechol 2,3-dioxygenase-like lactoylglutathione lyase family enzyme
MTLDLLSPGIEVGLATTRLDEMIEFYENFLGLQPQGEIEFPGGSQRRYAVGNCIVKLVTYVPPPAAPPVPGGGPAQAGIRYFTITVKNLREVADRFAESPYEVVEPLREFEPVPGIGYMFVTDPDGNWIEFVGTL